MTAAAADLSRAATMIELGRYDDAARLLAAVLASAPDSSRGWCLLARARLGAGDQTGAIAAAARASALDPADDWPYRLASTALLSAGRTGDAVAAAEQARRLAPHFWRAHVCVAQAAAADGQLGLAAQAARTVPGDRTGSGGCAGHGRKSCAGRGERRRRQAAPGVCSGDRARPHRRDERARADQPSLPQCGRSLGVFPARGQDRPRPTGYSAAIPSWHSDASDSGWQPRPCSRASAWPPPSRCSSAASRPRLAALPGRPELACCGSQPAPGGARGRAASARPAGASPLPPARPVARRRPSPAAGKIRKNLQGGNAPASGSCR